MTRRRWQGLRILIDGPVMLLLVALLALASNPLVASNAAEHAEGRNGAERANASDRDQQDGDQVDELEQLRRMLQASGPDGRESREAAVAQLLSKATPAAHRLLQEPLLQKRDPDQLRATILKGLSQHLLASTRTQFGGADPEVRQQILIGYVGACAPFWGDGANSTVRTFARAALRRVPAREFDTVARTLLANNDVATRVDVLMCLADMRQTLLAPAIADQLASSDADVRAAAQRALQLLIYAEEPVRTKKEFDAWHKQFGSWSYLDLVERAARRGPRPLEHLQQQLAAVRVEAAREFVTAHVVQTPGVDWAVVQDRTINGNAAVLDACLEALQASLKAAPQAEGNAMQRQAFCRALLDRFRSVPDEQQQEQQHRRALLLEVAAYLARPQETELANEIRTQLLAQLSSPSTEAQLAALRGLRRYPSPAARAALVAHAQRLLPRAEQNKVQLRAILDTLSSRQNPRWMAPATAAKDKADWLRLVTDCCRSDAKHELRAQALVLAQTLDRTEARVPEAFGILLALVKDPSLETKFRSTALIYLEAWRADQDLAKQWVDALLGLLEGEATALRLQAAGSLARLPESVNSRRIEWFQLSLETLRDRLGVEPDVAVLQALVECVRQIGKQPQMPERAIGAIKFALSKLEQPVAPEHQFRLEPLLQALAAIAADASADGGQWLVACDPLLGNGKRQSVRLILQSHDAIGMARSVASDDAAVAKRSKRAMQVVIEAATLKADNIAWDSSEQLQREARDVRTAFVALGAEAPDEPPHRVLRLGVDLAAGKFQEVVQRATAWLAGNGEAAPAGDAAHQDELRLLAAEAQLALSKPGEARKLLEARATDRAAAPAALDLATRIARALAASDPKTAVAMFERTLRATATEDPAFRPRLLDWAKHQLQLDPNSREATLKEANRHRQLFEADDCPVELREAFRKLGGAG